MWRKAQALGLIREYIDSSRGIKGFVQKMAAVAFCPLTFVRVAWAAVQHEASLHISRVDDLVEYFTNTWMKGNFPPVEWNYFNRHQPRTIVRPR